MTQVTECPIPLLGIHLAKTIETLVEETKRLTQIHSGLMWFRIRMNVIVVPPKSLALNNSRELVLQKKEYTRRQLGMFLMRQQQDTVRTGRYRERVGERRTVRQLG